MSIQLSSGQLRGDALRPRYHFLPPSNWLNDPNGLIQWNGRYHLFYQHNPNGPFHDSIHWGHAVSADLVHWEHLPVALAPTPGGPDADGCWSGCAVDDDGVPTLLYSGNRSGAQRACLATSTDGLRTWHKHPGNPVIVAPPPDLDLVEYRDHCVWRENGMWYQLMGAGIAGQGGAALLYRSDDLRSWEYLHPLYVGDAARTEPVWTGSMWECPDFFALGDRHVLVVSVWDQEQLHYPVYFAGRYADHRFTPKHTLRFDLGSSFYAPQSMRDAQGHRLMWGWLREGRSDAAQREAGWSGVMSLPRLLIPRPDGLIGIAPAPALRQLRGGHTRLGGLSATNGTTPLPGIPGDRCEIIATWAPGDARAFGLKVRCSPDGVEQTSITYDREGQRLLVDRTRASLSDTITRDRSGGAFTLAEDEPLTLHIFLDGSTIEIFANERATLCERIYPTRADSLGVAAFVDGGTATLEYLDSWALASIW